MNDRRKTSVTCARGPARVAAIRALAALLTALLLLAGTATPAHANGCDAACQRTEAKAEREQQRQEDRVNRERLQAESNVEVDLTSPTTEVELLDDATTQQTSFRSGTLDSADRPGSLFNVVDQIGARALWERGITGHGIDVAVIDTGVAPVPALTGADKVVAMVDLSFEAGVPEAQYLDTFGHGSHIAGIIAGSDPGGDPATAAERPDEFQGVAPGAGIVSVKVGDNTGAVDVTQVIAALDWVVEHRNEGDLNIRVVNLSYGTDSTQGYVDSPLAFAVERAWHAGIVVVVSAGNEGWREPGLASPANDPYVIAVGASEHTKRGPGVPSWASTGEWSTTDDDGFKRHYWDEGYTGRYPDLIAPGASIESLRVPGSRIAIEHPEGMVNDLILRGSGTSQSAAVVSGAVALLLQDRPELTPDQVKSLLMNSANYIFVEAASSQGSGVLDISGAAALPAPTTQQTWMPSTGTGSLEAARGSNHVVVDGVTIEGEITVWGDEWKPDTWIAGADNNETWTGGEWNGNSWTGSSWMGNSWTGSSWTGSSWTGNSWTGSSWTGNSWTGNSWTGNSWTGSSWTGNSWTGNSWTGNSWTDYGWLSANWT